MRTVFLVMLAAVLAPISAHGQRPGNIRGAGSVACGEFLSKVASSEPRVEDYRLLFSNWTTGYLSAYNLFSSHKPVELPPDTTLIAYLEKYCRDNPLKHVAGGVHMLIGDLGGWKFGAK